MGSAVGLDGLKGPGDSTSFLNSSTWSKSFTRSSTKVLTRERVPFLRSEYGSKTKFNFFYLSFPRHFLY